MSAVEFIEKINNIARQYCTMNGFEVVDKNGNPAVKIVIDEENNKIIITCDDC